MTAKYKMIDALIILLNIAAGRGNALPFLIFNTNKSTIVWGLIAIIDFIYLYCRNYKNVPTIKIKGKNLVLITIILLFYNLLNIAVHGHGDVITNFLYLLDFVLFLFILYKQVSLLFFISDDSDYSVKELLKGYKWLSLISILGVSITLPLLMLGYNSEIPLNMNYMADNLDKGTDYYWTFLSIKNISTDIRVPIFQDHGILCGLFHEPHILTYNVFPCLFLMLSYIERTQIKTFVFLLAILVMLIAGSATNVIVSAFCLSLYFIKNFRHNHFSIALYLAILLLIGSYIVTTDNTFVMFLSGRLESDNASQMYSRSLLNFILTPKTFWGTNFLSTNYVNNIAPTENIGYLPLTLFVTFLYLYISNIIKLIKSSNKINFGVGIASLYYLLHSAKMGMTMFYQTLPLYLIFLQILILSYNGRINCTSTDVSEGNR